MANFLITALIITKVDCTLNNVTYLRRITSHCALDQAFTIIFKTDSKYFDYSILSKSGPTTMKFHKMVNKLLFPSLYV